MNNSEPHANSIYPFFMDNDYNYKEFDIQVIACRFQVVQM